MNIHKVGIIHNNTGQTELFVIDKSDNLESILEIILGFSTVSNIVNTMIKFRDATIHRAMKTTMYYTDYRIKEMKFYKRVI